MPGAGESRTSTRRVESAERQRKALQLRLAGASFEAIARTPRSKDDPRPMYSSRKRAHEAVTRALAEIRTETKGTAEELRTLELARLEAMQVALWPQTRPTAPVVCECGCGHTMWREVDKEAIDRVIKIMERRAKYLGLDVKGAEQDPTGGTSMILNILNAIGEDVGPPAPIGEGDDDAPDDDGDDDEGDPAGAGADA